jgi:hypothetical protein
VASEKTVVKRISPSSSRPASGGISGFLEYAARLAFFACVPFIVVLLAMLVPMGAAIVNMILALLAFFFGEVLLGAAEKRPWLKRVLRRQLAFEAYYREHPPRAFLYYVFYPLLFPYWLSNREARREFVLFKGYTILTLGLIATVGVYRYYFVYQPELRLSSFISAFAITLVFETLAVTMFLMPMVTTVVALHRQKHHRRLMALLAVGIVSAAAAGVLLARRHRSFPSLETRHRVIARTAADKPRSKAAMKKALTTAWAVRRADPKHDAWERETDGTITGAPLTNARDVLEEFYREDEANAFELWTTSRREKPATMIVFAEGRRKGIPVWLGMRSDGTFIEKLPEIPKTARQAMRSAGDF